MNKNLSKKDDNLSINKRNPFIIRITAIIIAMITAITLVGCGSNSGTNSETNLEKEPETPLEIVLKAWENTFELSNNQINEVFGFDEFSKTIENGTYAMSIDVPIIESSFKFSSENKTDGQLKLDILGYNFLDLYANLKESFVTSDLVSGKLYGFNYEELYTSDLDAKEIFLYIIGNKDKVNSAFEDFVQDLTNEYKIIFEKVSVEELSRIKQEIDGKQVHLEGFRFNLTEKDVAEMIIYTLERIQEDEFIKYYLAFNLSSSYYSINDALEDIEIDIQYNIDEFKNYLNSDTLFMTMDTYLYDGYVAKAEIEFIDEEVFVFAYETKGGSYPFENAIFSIIYDDVYFELNTFGENTNEIFKLGFTCNVDGTESPEIYFEYNKNTNQLVFFDGYDSFEALVNKLNPGKELSILFNIYGVDTEFNFVNTAEIQIPTGDYINLLELTDEEIDQLVMEIEENFYMILYVLLYSL